MPLHRIRPTTVCALLLLAGAATAQPAAPSRGQTLYELHCIGCHGAQMHWRDRRQATDWPSLVGQVRLWQANALLNWSNEDVDAVARYLNATIYRFPQPPTPIGEHPREVAPTAALARAR